MKGKSTLFSLLALVRFVAGAAVGSHDGTRLERRAEGTAVVNLAQTSGTPQHLASGFIYGLPDNSDGSASTAIPRELAEGTGYIYNRAGGAQLPSPSLGYASGQLTGRLQSFSSNYKTARSHGAGFQLLVHDLWGADSVQGTIPWPGDNGNWAFFDTFLTQVMAYIKNNNLQSGLELDLWNEPDAPQFWGASYDQYLQTWTRMYQRFKSELPNVPILGPSISQPPTTGNTRWTAWLDHVKSTNTVPDKYTYHILTATGSAYIPRNAQDALKSMTSARGMAMKPVSVNEYGAIDGGDQTNSASAWYIGAFEREGVSGLRAHWGMGAANLHNGMAGLVNFSGSNYFRAAQWWVYNYYTHFMTGNRVATTSSGDRLFEVYATRGSSANSVKILTGLKSSAGDRVYDVRVTGLSAVGISGTVKIRTLRFNHVDWWLEGPAPTDLGTVTHTVTNNEVTFFVDPDNQYTAYAFEFVS
ncbi:hypothetical protein CGCSCA4_v009792 [Colletotrichum siamense]|uniref:Glycoside hydrolase family 39 protein n=1 Tax=Colletotrichum siamense TaxID=690259 RepID=A0A9P5EQD1_COLSI|nr:hypothetical protein CGCSCA4_v009792 [Colletotrichum siamense]KAF4857607.1 hypothetical protein CGCSCA2_v008207 [Colletotrichum siamense]